MIDFKANILIYNILIPRVSFTKFLGLWIDDKLTWQIHVEKLLSKLKSRLGMLYKNKNLLVLHSKRILYFGQIYSNLCYGIRIWGPMVGVSHINKLIKIQNRCVSQINPTACISDIYSTYHLLNLHQIIRLEQTKLHFKLCHNMLPPCVSKEMLTDQNSKSIVKTHNYETRKKTFQIGPTPEISRT